MKLVTAEHPPMGVIEVLGQPIWLGWLMLPALVWSGVPAFFLGRAKMPLASGLHDKVLYADAKMNKADWLTAGAAIVGVFGIGLGLWWADAAAAIVISDIVRDGYTNLRASVSDLMDSRPTRYDGSGSHPLTQELEKTIREMDWVEDAQVRLREEGHVFAGEALVVPVEDDGLVDRLDHAAEELRALDWRMFDLVQVPVAQLLARADVPAPQAEEPSTARSSS